MLGRNSLSCTQACSCPSGRVENPRAQNQPACHLSTDPCQPSWPRDSYLFSMPVHAPALPYSTAFTESASPLPRLPYPNDLSVPTLITGGGGLQPQQHRHTKITATFRDSSGLLVVALQRKCRGAWRPRTARFSHCTAPTTPPYWPHLALSLRLLF